MPPKRKTDRSATVKYLLMLPLIMGLLCVSIHAFAQTPPPGPPGPPPPPGELFKKINPFKKHKKDTAKKTVDTSKKVQPAGPPAGGPPPPPNPLDLFKKKKKDTTKSGKS